jgi:hypothetical protein
MKLTRRDQDILHELLRYLELTLVILSQAYKNGHNATFKEHEDLFTAINRLRPYLDFVGDHATVLDRLKARIKRLQKVLETKDWNADYQAYTNAAD